MYAAWASCAHKLGGNVQVSAAHVERRPHPPTHYLLCEALSVKPASVTHCVDDSVPLVKSSSSMRGHGGIHLWAEGHTRPVHQLITVQKEWFRL